MLNAFAPPPRRRRSRPAIAMGKIVGFPKIVGLPKALKRRRIVRDLLGLPATLGRMGALEVRLATTKKEIRKAQRLRYKVFYTQGGAVPDRKAALTRRDICPFDRVSDHLIVIDHAAVSKRLGIQKSRVVGAYRLLRQDVAQEGGGFYTAREFNLAPLVARHPGKRFLEMGRSCVLPEYRQKRTIELLWQGIGAYIAHHRMDVLIGCASLHGCDAGALAQELGFLHHFAGAGDEDKRDWRAAPVSSRHTAMDALAKDAVDKRKALHALPPLVKAYLRCGAMVGQGAVVDRQFGTTDVLMIMPVAAIDARYLAQFGGAIAKAA